MINNNEIIRLRRQMHQRIRAVVAERRVARQQDSADDTAFDSTIAAETSGGTGEGSLIGG
ncbi:hypothetical protein [Micromonospora sp. NBC_01796]|uniref:hypothetical protein n=1 Tax=Micromonospora sp. NBC_01796 TaxID=2975987 RepID=UPI002DDB5BCF|nr:hypothetical protein [Micromonospora sp. NBC_01796]WSA89356.1 hypothetical protein OIE47_18085 [Micromonospora sp. NBC_01796]